MLLLLLLTLEHIILESWLWLWLSHEVWLLLHGRKLILLLERLRLEARIRLERIGLRSLLWVVTFVYIQVTEHIVKTSEWIFILLLSLLLLLLLRWIIERSKVVLLEARTRICLGICEGILALIWL